MPTGLTHRPTSLPAEILDALPAHHPDAIASRRDLRLFNAALGNWGWFRKQIPRRVRPGESVIELGSGLGELAKTMQGLGIDWNGLDRAPRPSAWPRERSWHQDDIFKFDGWQKYPVIAGNLIFHHFDDAQLHKLGRVMRAHARLIVIGDLRRGRAQQLGFLAYALIIRANRISRHDGDLSIRAGFRKNELAELLGLTTDQWVLEVRDTFSSYRLVATRRP